MRCCCLLVDFYTPTAIHFLNFLVVVVVQRCLGNDNDILAYC